MRRATARLAALCLLLFLGTAALGAQDVAAWFLRSPDAGAYAGVKSALLALAERSRAGMHSDLPLAQRLAEGASKRVEPQRLLSALRGETEELLAVAGDIARRGLLPEGAGASGSMMAQIGIGLRAGLSRADILAAFDGALSRGSGAEARDRALATIGAVAGLGLPAEQRLALVRALAASSLPSSRLRSVRGALADLLARDYSPAEATAALIDSLSSGPPRRGSAEAEQGGRAQERPKSESDAERPAPNRGDGEQEKD